jgi:hypothetical protein
VKVRVILDDKGNVAAIERPQPGEKHLDSASGGGPKSGVTPAAGHKVEEVDVPNELEQIEDAAEFHARLLPHLKKEG